MSLDTAKIHQLPDHAYYIPNFITYDDEQKLLERINAVPLPRWTHLSHRRLQTWPSALSKSNTLLETPLPPWLLAPIVHPHFDRLGLFQDAPHGAPNHVLINEYRPGQGIMPHEDGAAYFPLVATISLGSAIVLDIYEKNHLHTNNHNSNHNNNTTNNGDKDYYTSNIGNEEMDDDHSFHRNRKPPRFRILQEPRSLLVTTGTLYTDYLHGITETEVDRDVTPDTISNWSLLADREEFLQGSCSNRQIRISLTYRDVIKVSKIGLSLSKYLSSSAGGASV